MFILFVIEKVNCKQSFSIFCFQNIFEIFENFKKFRKTTKFNKIECLFTIFDVFGNLVCVWVVNIQRCMAAHSGARRHCAGTYQMQPFALPGGGKFQYFLKKDVFLFCN